MKQSNHKLTSILVDERVYEKLRQLYRLEGLYVSREIRGWMSEQVKRLEQKKRRDEDGNDQC